MKRTPIKRISDRRRAELTEYSKRRKVFLAEHPICQIWLVENGWTEIRIEGLQPCPFLYQKGAELVFPMFLILQRKAPRSTQIHHTNKRRGPMLLETQYWLALCMKNHERVEQNKAWARANGYLLHF